jgi:hypothetical protein
MDDVAVADLGKAAVALKPLRVRILAAARTPASAATIAGALGLSRQAVNYHVRALARAGFLRRAGRVRKRGLVEQRYVVSARAFLVAPDVLGGVEPPAADVDRFSVAYVLTLAARIQHEAARAWRGAAQQGKRVPVLALDSELRFESPRQRAAFASALSEAVTRVIADHSSPTNHPSGGDAPGRAYRLALACYPL